jgi:hypothetical protein
VVPFQSRRDRFGDRRPANLPRNRKSSARATPGQLTATELVSGDRTLVGDLAVAPRCSAAVARFPAKEHVAQESTVQGIVGQSARSQATHRRSDEVIYLDRGAANRSPLENPTLVSAAYRLRAHRCQIYCRPPPGMRA